MKNRITDLLIRPLIVVGLVLGDRAAALSQRRADEDRDRGDVPGWVMITVMTAIVVIALLAVFKGQVVKAVQNAFDSVTGAG